MYANVIVDISQENLDRTFQYQVPRELEAVLQEGMVVDVPFGKSSRTLMGYVVELTEEAQYDPKRIKPVLSVRSDSQTVESRLVALAAWMKERYGSTMIQALKTVLPMKEKVKAKEKRKIVLAADEGKVREQLAVMEEKNYKARARILKVLLEEGEVDYTWAAAKLHTGANVLKPLEQAGLLRVESCQVFRNPAPPPQSNQEEQPSLSGEQQAAVEGICREWEQVTPVPCLLHGVTGSGKTRVYVELMKRVLAQGKQVIVLIPEIALTYQNVMRFYSVFGDKVSVLNSRMSQGERYDQFSRAKQAKVQVMIGPRSALFTPFPNLGLIIIDEEHENTYRSEVTPRYHARETAIQRAKLEGARVVMGSATPSVDAYYLTGKGEYRLFTLEHRVEHRPMPKVEIVDLRQELKEGNRSILSRRLKEAMALRLDRQEQVMLFLNRRGYAGFVSCRSCGHVVKCPHCDVSLSQHRHGKLVCHYCGYETGALDTCPSCGSPYIGGFKAGTQQIEDMVKKVFPKSRVLRMDADTTKKKDGHANILSAFARQEADILIGTQMIVKGHDFPKVTLVGVLAADLSLNDSDYRCGERTFQLLTQAVGRSGREAKGEAVIQTYRPEHYSIQAARDQDYGRFYQEEISYRSLLGYPPVHRMMGIFGSCPREDLLEEAMGYLEKYVHRVYRGQDLRVIGPTAETIGKINDIYRKVIYLNHPDYDILISIKNKLEEYIKINSGFRKLFIQFDFNV